ncbi:Zn-dependent hydrolase [Pantoea phytobeneficialis]|uniref:Zn-dependent hydrolase n=1 Tax=Pantoea phytobeneficialis TaxID=2052056 RepID=A0AAP9KS32_9GAMM|nr:Zn-dependent hydrolase [Pantoea phytobeneficialis]MDO6406593.1 Zn-dependent hydrolase [Pantoea phytobeneficialis]QGR09685.1 Zn-dependent hydrolase [Pantoea phytobeneficialis]
MLINDSRMWHWLLTLGQYTDPAQPYTRRSFSEHFLAGRNWLTQQMKMLGLDTHIDSAGNLIGRINGTEPDAGTLVIGSHSDTVPGGGRFDGIAGVIAGLECIATMKHASYRPRHSIEIIDYLAEEPSEWGISCVGSRGISGFLNEALLKTLHPETGESLRDAIRRMGGKPDQLSIRKDIKASFELHIEQGQILEQHHEDIGIVSGIVGILRLSLTLVGQAAHAGTTPMNMRQDALVAAANTIQRADKLAREVSAAGEHHITVTCGQIFSSPNASNVVPGEVRLVFDIRSDSHQVMEDYADALRNITGQVTQEFGVSLQDFAILTDTQPTLCNAQLMSLIQQSSQQRGWLSRVMPSGAGHDSAFLATLAPAAMLFVPSLLGKSHCPEEWTSQEQLARGISVLLDTVLAFDRQGFEPSVRNVS